MYVNRNRRSKENNKSKELEVFTNGEWNSKVNGVNRDLQFFNINFVDVLKLYIYVNLTKIKIMILRSH